MADAPFRDRVVVITGASSGIGAALAHRLAAQEASVVVAARRVDRLGVVAAKCEELGGRALVVPTDVSDEAQCRRLIERTVEAYEGIDMLVNNAGFTVAGTLRELPSLKPFKQVVDVDLMGAVYCTYYALPYLKQTRGRIVAMSSVGGKAPVPRHAAYAASKHGLVGFFNSLRLELREEGVSVTVVYPDFVVTEFAANIRTADGQRVGEEVAREFYTHKMMSADTCARIIIDAAARRKREVAMSMRGRLVGLMMAISPGLVDRLVSKAMRANR